MSQKTQPEPVLTGSVFATLVQEMIAVVRELEWGRAYVHEVGAYLASRGLTQDFAEYRTHQSTPASKPSAPSVTGLAGYNPSTRRKRKRV